MSPHTVNNFVSDLVLMAQAVEKLPTVEAELASTKHELDAAYGIVQDRELRIIDLKTEIDDLTSKLRSAEVSRDDAEMRFLEIEDSLGSVAKAFQVALEAMDHTDKVITKAIDNASPEPIAPQAPTTPAQEMPVGQSETLPTSSPIGSSLDIHGEAKQGVDPNALPPSWASPGESAVDPTNATTQKEDLSGSAAGIATSEVNAPSDLAPYYGKRYVDIRRYIRYDDWIDGGGTYDGYYTDRF